jgi:hypothetical protein
LTTRRTNRHYLPMKYFEKVALAIVVAATLSGPLSIRSAEAKDSFLNSELTRALEDLQNSDAAWRSQEAKYRQQRVSGGLSAEEASEYAEFVASLHRQKLENCETVRRLGGNKALTGFDCVREGFSGGAPAAAALSPEDARTNSEKVEDLDAELKRLEAELDEELQQKQLENSSREQNSQAGGRNLTKQEQGQGADSSRVGANASANPKSSNFLKSSNRYHPGKNNGEAYGTPVDQKPGNSGKHQTGSATAYPPASSAPGAVPANQQEKNTASANRHGNDEGKDDDIVMRQIREAAEREADPVMREQLWNEYRKLKSAKR